MIAYLILFSLLYPSNSYKIKFFSNRLSLATRYTPNENELLSESHFLSRFNGFVVDVIPAVAAKYLEDDQRCIKWKNKEKVENYLKDLTSHKVVVEPPAFVSTENLMKVMEEEEAHYVGNQDVINSICQMYLPELDVDEYEEFNVVMTEDMFYVAFPDKLNNLMQRTDMNPMKEVKVTRDFVDEVINDEEKLRGLFPMPSTVDANIVHFPDTTATASFTKSKQTGVKKSSLFEDLEVYVAEGAASALRPSEGPNSKLSQGKYSPQPYAWRKGVNLSKLKKTLEKDPDYFKH